MAAVTMAPTQLRERAGEQSLNFLLPLMSCWCLPLAKPIPASRGALEMKFIQVSPTENRAGQRKTENGARGQRRTTSMTILRPVVGRTGTYKGHLVDLHRVVSGRNESAPTSI